MPATEQFWRDPKKMHVVFCVSAVALFGATILMMARDHLGDEWRDYRRTTEQLQVRKLQQKERDQLETQVDPADYPAEIAALIADKDYGSAIEALREEQARAEQELKQDESDLRKLRERVRQREVAADLATRALRTKRAERDVARANYDLAIRDSRPQSEVGRLQAKFDEEQRLVNEREVEAQRRQVQLEEVQKELADKTADRDRVQAARRKLETDINLLTNARQKLAPDDWLSWGKRKMMEWPIIDGFNSHMKIENDWLPDLKITLGMTQTARQDRCRTCHVNIDAIEPGNKPAFPLGHCESNDLNDWCKQNLFPHPYASHPRLDLFLTDSSPHPVSKFGCTICHDGQGSGTGFSTAAHLPNDPHQHHDWENKYGFATNHFWEYPMFPKRLQEASCIKCHHSVVELGVNDKFGATAPKAFHGYQLINKLGCFGCHEINGEDGGRSIGPDLRLEPNYHEAAAQLLADAGFGLLEGRPADDAQAETVSVLSRMEQLARTVAKRPIDSDTERRRLRDLIVADQKSKQPALTRQSHALADVLKDHDSSGDLRKVGPALRHIASKTTSEWIGYWTEEPKRFRPSTTMPQFFKLSNQTDDHAQDLMPVELAGVAEYLVSKSQPIDLLQPADDYRPNPERGKRLFSRRGCLACHSHEAFSEITADFGPNLSDVHAKVRPDAQGFNWLYSWIRDPERYHARTKMPNLFLEPEGEGDRDVDPAADIAAFLLEKGPAEYKPIEVDDQTLDRLVRTYLTKVLTKDQIDDEQGGRGFMQTRQFPIPAEQIKGDEIELTALPADVTDEDWRQAKLRYVGRRTISQYGCYGCHDIPGFETARPIGTPLHDWGRKDTSRLAFEHIAEFLHHHGEPNGSSTANRIASALKKVSQPGEFKIPEEEEREMRAAFFYESLMHHERPGFIWQKLRDPRSYDFEKTGTMGYDERLRMPKFPVDEEDIEAIATFVLGLVAEPPAEKYVFRPAGPAHARIEGERLLEKYNCASCHVIDLGSVTYGLHPDFSPREFAGLGPDEHGEALDLLMHLKPPREAKTGETREFDVEGELQELPLVTLRGIKLEDPDPELADYPDEQLYLYHLWENTTLDGKLLSPSAAVEVPAMTHMQSSPPRGGRFAEWLVGELLGGRADLGRMERAWQQAPPPLYLEGQKVQTPWLYRFLKDPVQLRHTTVLRMPRFNMSDAEARALANYFAAADGVPYPYQDVPQQHEPYLATRARQLAAGADQPSSLSEESVRYLKESWHALNDRGLCIKCHSVGGQAVQVSNPEEDIRGPDLEYAGDRLRPDWLMLWLYNPKWITPYTSMPALFPRTRPPVAGLLNEDGELLPIGVRDALMNYYRLMERHGTLPSPAAPVPVETEERERTDANDDDV